MDRLGWADSITVAVGDWHLGVRISRAEVAEILRDALSGALVEDVAPPNWSLRIGGFAEDPSGADLQLLYRARRQAARSRRPADAALALLAQLATLAGRDLPGHRVDALVLRRSDGGAVLAPSRMRRDLARIGPRLAAAGLVALPTLDPRLDPSTGRVLIPEPFRSLDPEQVAALDALVPGAGDGPATSEEILSVGWHDLAGWGLHLPEDPGASIALASTMDRLAPMAVERGQPVLDAMAGVVDRVPVVALPIGDERRTVEILAGLAS